MLVIKDYTQKKYSFDRIFIITLLLCSGFFNGAFAQSFKSSEKGIISDKIESEVIPSFFKIDVNGLPEIIDENFGLEKVCFHIKHKRPIDLKIELLSPDGTMVWLSNRNGEGNNYGYLHTCFTEKGFNGEVYNPERFFEGEYTSEGRMDFFNNGQNPNGIWLLIISDLKEGVVGKLENVELTFGANPANSKVSPCNKENLENCYSSSKNSKLLPDLIISKELTNKNISFFDSNSEEYPNELRFAAAMANIGEGPLEIITTSNWYCNDKLVDENIICEDGTYPTNNVQQIIYKINNDGLLNADTIKSGTLYFDNSPGHNHYHVENWADFKLLKKRWWTNNPKKWKIISSSSKVSYCLFDNKICTKENGYCNENGTIYSVDNLINYGLGRYTSCNSKIQGISVGGIDYYGMFYEGQSIKVPKDIKRGMYYLFIEVDPLNEYEESNENNNIFITKIEIRS